MRDNGNWWFAWAFAIFASAAGNEGVKLGLLIVSAAIVVYDQFCTEKPDQDKGE